MLENAIIWIGDCRLVGSMNTKLQVIRKHNNNETCFDIDIASYFLQGNEVIYH